MKNKFKDAVAALKKENNTNKILPELIDGEKKEFFCKYTFKYIISSRKVCAVSCGSTR